MKSTARPSQGLRYMPALDGLRALAVLAVVLYHLGVPGAQGGLIGVTVFFVISGYLICKLLLHEYVGTRTIDLKRFYLKRVKRLLPAILLVVVATAALCTLFNHPLLTKMRPDVVPSLLFFNNWWQIANEVSYFDQIGGPSPLTHFWSLAIEEQFYLVLPLALFLALRFRVRRNTMIGGTLGLAALSFLAMVLLFDPAADPTRVYYGTDTRAFSLLLGVALAMATFGKRGERLSPRLCDLLAVVGLGGLVLFVVFSDGTGPFLYRGGFLLASLLTCAAIVGLVQPGGGVVSGLLAVSPLLWLGTRSYGIYLWHYPLGLLMTPQNIASELPWWHPLLVALVIALVAEASYRFVEQPIRTGSFALERPWLPQAHANGEARGRRGREAQDGRGARRAAGAGRGADGFGTPDASQPARGRRPRRDLRPVQSPLPAPVATLGRLNPAVLAVGACAVVALCGFVFVPETSVLSEEGAALLAGGDDAVSTESVPLAVASAATTQDGENSYLLTDSRTPEQVAFDEQLVATPTPEGAYNVVWIGDSVSIRTLPYAKAALPQGYVDAKKNRTMEQGLEVLQELDQAGQVGNIVVLALGTNGALTSESIDQAVAAVGPDRALWLVTVRDPTMDVSSTNQAIWDAASRYENVRMIDWHGASEGRSDYFDGDGTHLSELGAQVYTTFIADGVAVELPEDGVEFQTEEEKQQTMIDSWTQPSAADQAQSYAQEFARDLVAGWGPKAA